MLLYPVMALLPVLSAAQHPATSPGTSPGTSPATSIFAASAGERLVMPWVQSDPMRSLSSHTLFDWRPVAPMQTLWRADDGLFYVEAQINGVPVRLIVDTGASMTVLSPDDARRVGLAPQPADPTEVAQTANGTSHMARIRLDSMQVGQTSAANVSAVVASQPMESSLLGQNWLSRMDSVTIQGDRMILR